MILKTHKGKNELIIGLIILFLVLISNFRMINFEILAENFREKVLSYDLGFSRWHNISDASSSKSNQLISVLKRIPNILHQNIIGYERIPIEKLEIDIKFLDYKRLLSNRDEAIRNDILREPDVVDALITYKGQKFKASVRLKGDLSDHWTSVHRFSLRVNLKGANTIFGLNEFNIQKPRTRSYPFDAVFQETLRSTGNLSTEHNYVNAKINGESWGVMNVESHIDKQFLERNKKKDSVVVRFSNEDGWFYQKTFKKYANKNYRLSNPILFSKVYSSNKSFNPEKRNIYTYIVEERINQNPELYDVDSYSKLLFLAKLWGEEHVLYENNTKHYFNPYTLKLEPISSDQYQPKKLTEIGDFYTSMGKCTDGFSFIMEEPYQSLKNTENFSSRLVKNYSQVLEGVNYIEDHLNKHSAYFPLDNTPNIEILNNNIAMASTMRRSFFTISDKCKEEISAQDLNKWNKSEYNFSYHTQTFHYDNGRVKVFNLLPNKIKILGILVDNERFVAVNHELPGHDNISFEPYVFDTDIKGVFDDRLEIVTEYQGVTRNQKLYKTLSNSINNPLKEENVENFEFVKKKDSNTWLIPSGKWIINSPMVVHGNLIIEPGAELFFDEDAYLAINGAIIANGDKKQNITLTSKNDSWMGLYVYESSLKSNLRNVNIYNTISINDDLLKLTGGVTFYNANVDIIDSNFSSSLAEDMLNIVNSDYFIDNTIMSNAEFDAIDSDFSNGQINNLDISKVGGDAIDTSGSNVNISNIKITNVVDKAISAGESSNLNITECMIKKIGVGVASKDGSNVSIVNCGISNSTLSALMSYKKKNFYSQPKLFANSIIFDVETKYIRQKGSVLEIDKVLIPFSEIDVEDLYQSSFMSK